MKLSPNFTLEEMTRTSYPRLQDVPTELQVMNMVYLCAAVLQPLRDELGKPVQVTSGYRSARLNAHVGGVPNSYHLQGLAADIHVDSEEDARRKFEILRNNPAVDSVLFEHAKSGSRWLHVQTKRIVQPRRLANFNYKAL